MLKKVIIFLPGVRNVINKASMGKQFIFLGRFVHGKKHPVNFHWAGEKVLQLWKNGLFSIGQRNVESYFLCFTSWSTPCFSLAQYVIKFLISLRLSGETSSVFMCSDPAMKRFSEHFINYRSQNSVIGTESLLCTVISYK